MRLAKTLIADAQADFSPRWSHKSYCRFCIAVTKTSLFKYTENFTTKNENFQIKNLDIFHISAQNIVCEYSLEPPWRGGCNEYDNLYF